MMLEIILMAVMAVLLIAWVIFCAVQFIRHSKNVIAKGDFTGHVRCEKCSTEYDVTPEEFTQSNFAKYRSFTKTKIKGIALVNRPNYRYFAKKFYCPHCGKKRYAQVLNINEINDLMTVPSIVSGIKWLAVMAIGGAVIIAIMSIPLHFAKEQRLEHVRDLEQKQYEDFIERYDVDRSITEN